MSEFFRTYVAHNFGLKLVSLLLATGLWLAVVRNPVAEAAVEVPIVFRNIPDNLGMTYERIPRVQILLRGPERVVRRLQPTDVHAEIDLTGGQPGERMFPASAVHVYAPHELEVVSKGPDSFKITFVALSGKSPESKSINHP